jgi:predicted Zn finger-like uncharacterized protein
MEDSNNNTQKDYISFRCRNCEALLRVKKESAGGKGQCPECGHIIKIPQKKK